jgi:hypothetical protein
MLSSLPAVSLQCVASRRLLQVKQPSKQVDIDATCESQKVKVLGDWAYIWTQLSVVFTPKSGGASTRRAGNTLSILRKQGVTGFWFVMLICSSPIEVRFLKRNRPRWLTNTLQLT